MSSTGSTAPVSTLKGRERLDFLLKVQMIFQDPHASLNPRMKVSRIVGEALAVHRLVPPREIDAAVDKVLSEVGLDLAYRDRFPHQFSGGQRQRIGIARALAVKPDFLVCDEPVSALDVSIQAQVIGLLEELRRDLGLTILFIAHDLSVVKHLSDEVMVLYLGRMMEKAPSSTLFSDPRHPYTQALLSAVPIPDPQVERTKRVIALDGDLPSPMNPPSGCVFRTRCPRATGQCASPPPEEATADARHHTLCHFPGPAAEMIG